MKTELFYSSSENILFYVIGYAVSNLTTLRKQLDDGEYVLRQFEPNNPISTDEIPKSRRYKYMRYFCVSCEKCPEEALELGSDWKMWQWLTN